MDRLYFILPNVECASQVAGEIRSLGITNDHIHIFSKDLETVSRKTKVLPANVLHVSDAWHMAKQGAIGGFLCGIAVLLYAGTAIIEGLDTIALGSVIGSMAGGILCFLIGCGRNDYNIEQHQADIAEGMTMLLVDVDKQQKQNVVETVKGYHDDAQIEEFTGKLHL